VRDESTEQVRLVLVPRSRAVPDDLLMEQLFRQTELEVRLSLNLNVLDAEGVPRVMGLRQVLEAFLAHRMVVLIRKSRHRLAKIEDRLEVLGAFRIAYLNLDEVIRIIREEDEPKVELMRAFELTERQAEAILNMRLRNLRRLEEEGLVKEERALRSEGRSLKILLRDEGERRAVLKTELAEAGARFGDGALGARRTTLGTEPVVDAQALEIPVERQPVTVVCSQQGWIRVLRGHLEDPGELKYKEGDAARFVLPAQSTDKLLLISSDGRGYLVPVDRLPGGRGQGEPLRLLIDLNRGAELAMLAVHRAAGRVLLASSTAHGFIAEESAMAAQTKAGKQVLNLAEGERLAVACPAEGDHVATVGTHRKLLLFPIDQLPVMSRGKGVVLQRYRGGSLADARVITLAEGLSWPGGRGTRTVTDLETWLGRRGQAGRAAPHGFPRNNRFDG
jgi:topoisomerase-4 subunit A